MSLTPVGKRKEEYKIKISTPPSSEDIDKMNIQEAIVYLRNLPVHGNDTFPWPLVERHVKEYTKEAEIMELPDSFATTEPDEKPQDGYRWFWVSSMARLYGIGGWLEVDIQNKRQGRFKLVAKS